MASISHSRPLAGVRWALMALVRGRHPAPRAADDVAEATAPMRHGKPRRHYPPHRDSLIEQSAMAREMFRL